MTLLHSDIKSKKEIIKKAICHYVALFDNNLLSEKFFKHLLPNINVNFIPDRELLSNKKLINNIDWEKFENIKIIRLAIRDKMILEKIDLSKRNFSIKELLPLFLHHPDLVEFFEIDFNSLSSIEAINMLEVNPEFIDKIELSRYHYNKLEINEIVKKFSSKEKIINKLDLSDLDHFGIRTLLIKTGNKHIDKLILKNLKNTDWLEILSNKPELLDYCNLLLFEQGDCFLLTKLIKLFPQLDYLIEENKDKITAIGWEKLLIENPDKFSKICKFELLSKKNWENIIKYHPNLDDLKKRYILL